MKEFVRRLRVPERGSVLRLKGEFDAVREEIVTGVRRWFKLVKLADRYEPFCTFVLKLIDPAKFGQLQAETGNRLSAAKVLKALALINNKALSVFEACPWEQCKMASEVRHGDCLEVARGLAAESVDLVHVDPPFFTQKTHSLVTRDRATKLQFSDEWKSRAEYSAFDE